MADGGCGGCWPSVRTKFLATSTAFEGAVPYMYLDSRKAGLVTIGVGNMIDSSGSESAGLANLENQLKNKLTYLSYKSGSKKKGTVTWDDVVAEWKAVRTSGKSGSEASAFDSITDIRISNAGIAKMVQEMFDANDRFLVRTIPNYCEWPANAQFACHSMLWGLGQDGFSKFRKLIAALNAADFVKASDESHMKAGGGAPTGSLKERNTMNAKCFSMANAVVGCGDDLLLDPSIFYDSTSVIDSALLRMKEIMDRQAKDEIATQSKAPVIPPPPSGGISIPADSTSAPTITTTTVAPPPPTRKKRGGKTFDF